MFTTNLKTGASFCRNVVSGPFTGHCEIDIVTGKACINDCLIVDKAAFATMSSEDIAALQGICEEPEVC